MDFLLLAIPRDYSESEERIAISRGVEHATIAVK